MCELVVGICIQTAVLWMAGYANIKTIEIRGKWVNGIERIRHDYISN